jgi:hypothetical protein
MSQVGNGGRKKNYLRQQGADMWKNKVDGVFCIMNHNGEVLGKYKTEAECDLALERALYWKWTTKVKSRNPENDTTNLEQFIKRKEFSQKLAG